MQILASTVYVGKAPRPLCSVGFFGRVPSYHLYVLCVTVCHDKISQASAVIEIALSLLLSNREISCSNCMRKKCKTKCRIM